MTMPFNGFSSRAAEQKRLGQYFTGMPLATLASALGSADRASRIIDPMVGSGDMLEACIAVGADDAELYGVDIDRIALETARARTALRRANLTAGSAFSHDYGTHGFDLVITNPPYVRYQSSAQAAGTEYRIPSAGEVRDELLTHLRTSQILSGEDRESLLELASTYSGLADLAVPSWILCAALASVGGTVVMLVPQSWLNRDYASTVRLLLGRHFDVDLVLEDTDSRWFDEVLVRTSIVVARRKHVDLDAGEFPQSTDYVRGRVSAAARVGHNLVGSFGSVVQFAQSVPKTSSPTFVSVAEGIELKRVGRGTPKADSDLGWLHDLVSADVTVSLPQTLMSFGWAVGQGLRTGANSFFYAEAGSQPGEVTLLPKNAPERVYLPPDTLRPALRNQSELPPGYVVRADAMPGRALVLEGWASERDAAKRSQFDLPAMGTLDRKASTAIERAARTSVGGVPLPELSAVRTNVRHERRRNQAVPTRYWYQLPPLKARHQPDLIAPRVCGSRPRTLLNEGRGAVVDANFSSFWTAQPTHLPVHALLALLNSDFTVAALEHSAHVLGGGALKIEATHLRKLKFPLLSDDVVATLTTLGVELTTDAHDATEVLERVNLAVAAAIVGPSEAARLAGRLKQEAQAALQRRTPRKS